MSLAFQLYLAGLATISLPLLFHFLRRSPRSVLPFSSLMFLSASPPRLTRRSRIDHWLLLLLRAVALALLVFAFCRPYLLDNASLTWETDGGRRVAVLVDTSASMRRAGVWQQVEAAVDKTMDELKPNDDVALFAFGRRLEVVTDYPEDEPQRVAQLQAVRTAFRSVAPTWSATSLGAALAALATRLESMDDRAEDQRPLQIVLISDLNEGADLSALQSISWPERISVDVRTVSAEEPNAGLHWLERADELDPLAARMRVVNDGEAKADLRIEWLGGEPAPKTPRDAEAPDSADSADSADSEKAPEVPLTGTSMMVEASPGGSKIVTMRRPDGRANADRIQLIGDAHEYDNTCYVVPPQKRSLSIMFWGDERPDDTEGVRFYLENASATTPHQELLVTSAAANDTPLIETLESANLVVIADDLGPKQMAHARRAADAGCRILLVLRSHPAQPATPAWSTLLPEGVFCETTEAQGEYSLWTDIDFKHPIFSPLNSPRYNDFTKVQFWKHRRIRWNGQQRPGDAVRTLAKFDDGDVAIAQWKVGMGQVTLFASGWSPSDSRLALSTKFVPLAASLLDPQQADRQTVQYVVDEEVSRESISEAWRDSELVVLKPDGDRLPWPPGVPFMEADEPGIYRIQTAVDSKEVSALAVNLAPQESQTKPIDEQALVNNGVRLGISVALGVKERERQQKRTELEQQQKLWQWLVAACLVVLILETLLAGWYARRSEAFAPDSG